MTNVNKYEIFNGVIWKWEMREERNNREMKMKTNNLYSMKWKLMRNDKPEIIEILNEVMKMSSNGL